MTHVYLEWGEQEGVTFVQIVQDRNLSRRFFEKGPAVEALRALELSLEEYQNLSGKIIAHDTLDDGPNAFERHERLRAARSAKQILAGIV